MSGVVAWPACVVCLYVLSDRLCPDSEKRAGALECGENVGDFNRLEDSGPVSTSLAASRGGPCQSSGRGRP